MGEERCHFSFMVNGYPVQASYAQTFIDTVVYPLIEHWRSLAATRKERIVVFLGGTAGCRESQRCHCCLSTCPLGWESASSRRWAWMAFITISVISCRTAFGWMDRNER